MSTHLASGGRAAGIILNRNEHYFEAEGVLGGWLMLASLLANGVIVLTTAVRYTTVMTETRKLVRSGEISSAGIMKENAFQILAGGSTQLI